MGELDLKGLRQAFGNFMTGVTVVTALSEDGSPVGFTANSFTSVSLDPPLLLVCPGKHLSSFRAFKQCSHFAVSILAEGQEEISNIFASSKSGRFEQCRWIGDHNGTPVMEGASAHFSCAVHHQIDAGDHMILVGRVEQFSRTDFPGLGYWKGGYVSLAKERLVDAENTADGQTMVGAILQHDGAILINRTNGICQLPAISVSGKAGVRSQLAAHLAGSGFDARIGRVYSIFDNDETRTRFLYFRAGLGVSDLPEEAEFVPISQLVGVPWRSISEKVMMERYQRESGNNIFGLYVGDSNTGEVHLDDHNQG